MLKSLKEEKRGTSPSPLGNRLGNIWKSFQAKSANKSNGHAISNSTISIGI